MKTRSAPIEPPNIAAIVKARHHARVLCPHSDQSGDLSATGSPGGAIAGHSAHAHSNNRLIEKQKYLPDHVLRPLRGNLSPEDRRFFFQAVRLYGRNFTEITRYIRARGHRNAEPWTLPTTTISHNPSVPSTSSAATSLNQANQSSGVVSGSIASPGLAVNSGPTVTCNANATAVCSLSDLRTAYMHRLREKVRFFYQQTWHKLKRFIKFPDEVPQHVREVYALINYSVIRTRIKKPLDHRLGERLNELVHSGLTVIRHNGRRLLLRTPVCQALKQLNHITEHSHEFLLPEDIWLELVPSTQSDLWRVMEAEQNPRLRLRTDISRQLSDVIRLVEMKWQLARERMQTLLQLPSARTCPPVRIRLRTAPHHSVDGAIRLQEVARIRSGNVAMRAFIERLESTDDAVAAATAAHNLPTSTDYITNQSDPDHLSTGSDLPECDQISASHPTVTADNPTNSPVVQTSLPNHGVINVPTALTSTNASSAVELDVREIGRRVSQGIGLRAARSVKLLTLFLALGCPERIQFEYSFVVDKSVSAANHLVAAGHNFGLLCNQPNDPGFQGMSNGLRRLLHLNASDYILHRDWLTVQASLSGQPVVKSKPPCSTVPQTPIQPASIPVLSTPTLHTGTTGSTTRCTPILPSVNVTVVDSGMQPINHPTPSQKQLSQTRFPPVPSQPFSGSTSLVLLAQKGPVPIVERPLDHQVAHSSPTTSQAHPVVPVVSSNKIPIPRLTPLPPLTPAPVNTAPKESSLSALKDYNIRRKSGRVHRKLMIAPYTLPSIQTPIRPALISGPSPKIPVLLPKSSLPSLNRAPFPAVTVCTSLTCVLPIPTQSSIPILTPAVNMPCLDSEHSLGPLFDQSGTNQSSISNFSTDTLASILNTLRTPSSTSNELNLPNRDEMRSLSTPANLDNPTKMDDLPQSQDALFDVNRSYKWEDNQTKLPGESYWDDYLHHSHQSSSTPRPPSESPNIGDISLTDSMAAAVLETHTDDLEHIHSIAVDSTDGRDALLDPHSNAAMNPGSYFYNPAYHAPQATSLPIPTRGSTFANDTVTVDLNTLLQAVSHGNNNVDSSGSYQRPLQ